MDQLSLEQLIGPCVWVDVREQVNTTQTEAYKSRPKQEDIMERMCFYYSGLFPTVDTEWYLMHWLIGN